MSVRTKKKATTSHSYLYWKMYGGFSILDGQRLSFPSFLSVFFSPSFFVELDSSAQHKIIMFNPKINQNTCCFCFCFILSLTSLHFVICKTLFILAWGGIPFFIIIIIKFRLSLLIKLKKRTSPFIYTIKEDEVAEKKGEKSVSAKKAHTYENE